MSAFRMVGILCCICCSMSAVADSFLDRLQQAPPNERVILILNYFDTCQAVIRHPSYAYSKLEKISAIARDQQDNQLMRYVAYLKDTQAKHRYRTHAANAALFLSVMRRSEQKGDPQIAAICRHFAGQYYFLNREYGKAFEHLITANRAFRQIGFQHIPEISRYLYELAFNYYHFLEHQKVIGLLTEAARYPSYNANLAIQTHNTLGLVYARQSRLARPERAEFYARRAESAFYKARQLAAYYKDSVWIGIAYSNLGKLYDDRQQWRAALHSYQVDYQLGLKFGARRYFPHTAAMSIADIYWKLAKVDSCYFYLKQARHLYQLNTLLPDFGRTLNDEYFLKRYYDLSRRYCQETGQFSRAYNYGDSLVLINDQIGKRHRTEQISLVEQRLLNSKHQQEISSLESTQRAQQIILGGSALGFMAIAGLFYLLYQSSLQRRHQEKALTESQERALHRQKLSVEEDLQQAQTDLAIFRDNLAEKDQLIHQVTHQLATLSQGGNLPEERFSPVDVQQKLLSSTLLTNEDWDAFRQLFERLHPGFFNQLKAHYSGLSPAEERLMALSRLQVSAHQMSRMLGISPESIRKTRYRMRKKLGVNGSAPLTELFNDLPG